LPPGDEFARGEWRGRWVLLEAGGYPPVVPPSHYLPVLRLALPFKTFVLCERRGEPR
jgi:hypothetical protein